jgi:mannose-6-phosphate isomerase-like protein (cupin superfamily)
MALAPTQPHAVLDYASPRPRGKLRLPARSQLAVVRDETGVAVLETLTGQGRAIFAISFAALTLVAMVWVISDQFGLLSGRVRTGAAAAAVIGGLLWVGGLMAILRVIDNTWRRTVLRVDADGVSLEFSSPLARRAYRWEVAQIEEVRIERTSEAAYPPLGELQLHAAGMPIVHLFTDHLEEELTLIAQSARATLRLPPPETAPPIAPPVIARVAERPPPAVEPVNLAEKLALFSDHWHPRVVGALNGQHVKLAKLLGEFVWHRHDFEDELFLVISGRLTIQFRDRDVALQPGEFLIVPRGVEHRPVAPEEVQVLLFEPAGTLNTGNVRDARTVEKLPWL